MYDLRVLGISGLRLLKRFHLRLARQVVLNGHPGGLREDDLAPVSQLGHGAREVHAAAHVVYLPLWCGPLGAPGKHVCGHHICHPAHAARV